MELVYNDRYAEVWKKQLFTDISELLAEQGLLSNEEKNRIKVIVNDSNKE